MSLGDLDTLRLEPGDALFIDFDGTLAEIGPDPDAITLDPETALSLSRLALKLEGAVALLSGRDIRDLARRTPPSVWRAGGHGLEIVAPDAPVPTPPPPPSDAVLAPLRDAARRPGVRLELKGPVAALHYRAAPEAEAACLEAAREAARQAPDLVHQPGKMVVEVKPAGAHKGEALRRLAADPPFAGRRALMFGDDTTDEDAISAAPGSRRPRRQDRRGRHRRPPPRPRSRRSPRLAGPRGGAVTRAGSLLPPSRATGRTAGALYLGIILCGLFAEFFVRSQLLVPGEPAATARNIAAAPALYRVATIADFGMLLFDVALALTLYVYLRPVSAPLSLLAAFFQLAQAAVLGANLLNQMAAGFVLDPAGALAGLAPEERDAAALFFVRLHKFGYYAGLVFFGACCLVLGYLMIRAPYVPSVL